VQGLPGDVFYFLTQLHEPRDLAAGEIFVTVIEIKSAADKPPIARRQFRDSNGPNATRELAAGLVSRRFGGTDTISRRYCSG
jgi:hypothetical protein